MPHALWYNYQFFPAAKPILTPDSNGIKFGDGFFETMKFYKGDFLFYSFHEKRFVATWKKFDYPGDPLSVFAYLCIVAKKLVSANQMEVGCRVRITTLSKEKTWTNLPPIEPNLLIQTFALSPAEYCFNPKGWKAIGYSQALVAVDTYAPYKTNNFLVYLNAIKAALKCGADTAIVYNTRKRIADAALANIWIIKGGLITTPPSLEGAKMGVCKAFLKTKFVENNILFEEKKLSIAALKNADEIFITNTIIGLQAIRFFQNKIYSIERSFDFFRRFINPLNQL